MAWPKAGPGRPKGSKNKVTARREAEIKASGLTPIEYMLGVLRNPKSKAEDKRWAAQAAAPYCHPRLSTVEVGGKGGGPIPVSHEIVGAKDALDRKLARLAAGATT